MKKLLFLSAGVLAVISLRTYVQRDPSAQVRTQVIVKATKVLDVRSGKYLEEAAVLIEGDRIKEVGTAVVVQGHAHPGAKVIDLGRATLLPGLIDCHTHLMARFESGKNGYLLGLATKSQAYRALEGAADARETLQAGFTAVRDVENEGSGYADVALRDAINNGLVEGPRMQVATRAIAAVGQYNPFGVSPDLTDFPTGADMVSGVEEARSMSDLFAYGPCGYCAASCLDAVSVSCSLQGKSLINRSRKFRSWLAFRFERPLLTMANFHRANEKSDRNSKTDS